VAEGTPEEVAATPGSYTGEVLIPVLGSVTPGKTSRRPKASAPKTPAVPRTPAAKARTKKAAASVTQAPTRSRAAVNGSKPRAKVPAKVAKAVKVSAATKKAGRPKASAGRSGRR
jgi:excinuclease ABC subunit A